MISFLLCLSIFLYPQIINAASANPPYIPTEHILLNCGSSSNLTDADGQRWDGDVPDINKANISFPATAAEQNPSIGEVPYITARIFRSEFSYSFPVSPGQKILRLYFYPATYSGDLIKNQSFFSVSANQYSLLSNFSAYLSAQKWATLVKEFIINVGQIQLLSVNFSPSANSYAFINGIEVVQIQSLKLNDNTTAFETLYRLNVGGPAVLAVNDTGMFRQWFQDDEFIFGGNPGNTLSNGTISLHYTSQIPDDSAPSLVYTTARATGFTSDLTWKFQVDSGFNYLLRLHFCEFMPSFINSTNQRVFKIIINNQTAEPVADIIRWTGGTGIPVFRDYAIFVPNSSHSSQSKKDLFLALRPDFYDSPFYFDAILNGLEVFKLNRTAGNLAGPNPEPPESLGPNTKPLERKKSTRRIGMIVAVVGVVGGGVVFLALCFFLLVYRRRKKEFERKSASTHSRSTKIKKRKLEEAEMQLRAEYIHQLTSSDEVQNQTSEEVKKKEFHFLIRRTISEIAITRGHFNDLNDEDLKQCIQLQLTMISFLLCLSFSLHPQLISAANQPYTPTDHILLNCGSPSKLTTDGQSWDGDVGTKFSPDINKPNISFPATAAEQDPSITSQVPYMTARIFNSQFSYSFPVSPGQKILRLYFYPATYSGNLLKNQSFFSVTANQYSLLSNFSAYLSAQKSASLVKEFIINVGQIQLLNVTFAPAANSYAFVNGIEVVSIPDNFYMGSHDINNNPLKLVIAQTTLYDFDQNRTAFETVYRLNIGGQAISAVDDTGMFRQWFQDGDFIFGGNTGNPLSNATISLQYTSQTPNYTAPSLVYTTARAMGSMSTRYDLTWIFPVDSGFYYLLRLHFCEFMPYLFNATGQRVFTIVINNRTAEQSADVIWWAGGTGIPVFRDYAVFVPNASNSQSKQDLFLALHPDFEANPSYLDAILNGLEIFKLNSTAGNLAGPNPEPSGTLKPNTKPPEEKKRKGNNGIILGVFGGVVGAGVIVFFLALFVTTNSRPTKTAASEQHCLAEWARRCYTKGIVHQIVDPNLKVQIAPECLWSYSELAFNCLKDQGVDRPAMSDVVGSLEFALQLQEAADKDGQHCRPILIPLNLDGREGNITTSDDDTEAALTSGELYLAAAWNKLNNQSSTPTESFSTTSSSDNLKPGSVFSLSS
ncbi:OLC1v1009781C1 [Oldenlandia corymbosa var. corymbosa]|uniref:OLC1v1009781C1 n=1 Tax=Oldenlandia corymbosa var. corymbosa TaxID=529605 RepID=A0AAV1DS62_OLDCO|nr:OLC1v1009781C1 [Oldenlandia corymbosa var. corymbosa]